MTFKILNYLCGETARPEAKEGSSIELTPEKNLSGAPVSATMDDARVVYASGSSPVLTAVNTRHALCCCFFSPAGPIVPPLNLSAPAVPVLTKKAVK
jgi:hypothetical protein